MKCTALRGEPGALIDACIHLAITKSILCTLAITDAADDLHMQFDIVIIISIENKTCTVQSHCTSNSAAIYMTVFKAADTSMHLSSHLVLYAILTSNNQLYNCLQIQTLRFD